MMGRGELWYSGGARLHCGPVTSLWEEAKGKVGVAGEGVGLCLVNMQMRRLMGLKRSWRSSSVIIEKEIKAPSKQMCGCLWVAAQRCSWTTLNRSYSVHFQLFMFLFCFFHFCFCICELNEISFA